MSTVNSPLAKMQFFDSNGQPAVDYRLFTYIAGTSTKLATYTDFGGGSPNANPLRMDYRGECNLWIPPNVKYKYVFAPPGIDDPPTNPIWTVDNVVNSQLITLYGGNDAGSTNAYVLNFTANFTAYTDGTVIYWIPGNTNTGASTINVNGLGIVSIVNQDASALLGGQIIAGQIAQIMYLGGGFVLLSSAPVSGSFTGTLTGVSGTVTASVQYTISGRIASLAIPSALTGVSTATTCSITGLPAFLRPTTTKVVPVPNYSFTDNSVLNPSSVAVLMSSVASSIQFTYAGSTTGFTAANNKGVTATFSITYPLT